MICDRLRVLSDDLHETVRRFPGPSQGAVLLSRGKRYFARPLIPSAIMDSVVVKFFKPDHYHGFQLEASRVHGM